MAVAGMKRIPVATLQVLNTRVVPITTIIEQPPTLKIYSDNETTRAGDLSDAALLLQEGKKVQVDMRYNALGQLRNLLDGE